MRDAWTNRELECSGATCLSGDRKKWQEVSAVLHCETKALMRLIEHTMHFQFGSNRGTAFLELADIVPFIYGLAA